MVYFLRALFLRKQTRFLTNKWSIYIGIFMEFAFSTGLSSPSLQSGQSRLRPGPSRFGILDPAITRIEEFFCYAHFSEGFKTQKRHQFDNHLSSFEDWGDQNQKNVFQRKMVKVRVCQVSKEWSRREGWVGIFLRLRCWIIMLISKEKRIINILLTLCSFHPKQLCILWKG